MHIYTSSNVLFITTKKANERCSATPLIRILNVGLISLQIVVNIIVVLHLNPCAQQLASGIIV